MPFDCLRGCENQIDDFLEKCSVREPEIVLCGAGFALKHIYQKLSKAGCRIVSIVDRNPSLHGKIVMERHVVDCLDSIAKAYPNAIYVVSSPVYFWDILRDLEKIFPALSICPLDFDCSHYFSGRAFRNFLFDNLERFNHFHSILSDQLSRNVLVNVVRAHITGQRRDFENACSGMDDWYLFDSLLRPAKGCSYVDCGAFDGDTVFRFINAASDGYDEIVAIEPDERCHERLVRNLRVQNVSRVTVVKDGASNTKGVFSFISDGMYSAVKGGNASALEKSSEVTEIHTDTIDAILGGRKANLIKMDIEGGEYMALQGCRETIERHQPDLAICVYHNIDDFVRIPELIMEINPGYRLLLRHQSRGCTDTILFAIS